jgi:hypothetical protein
MDRLKYFFNCYFHINEDFDNLDNVIKEFKKTESNSCQLLLIKELHDIIQTKNYALASPILKEYGGRTLDNEEEIKTFITFLYDRLSNSPTDVKPEDFKKKCKGVFCPVCTPDIEKAVTFSFIEKATVIGKAIQIYICKACKLVWLTEDIRADNAQDYKKFMQTIGLKGLWTELKDIDYL